MGGSEKLLYEEDVIVLCTTTQAHVIHVWLHLNPAGNQFLCKGVRVSGYIGFYSAAPKRVQGHLQHHRMA